MSARIDINEIMRLKSRATTIYRRVEPNNGIESYRKTNQLRGCSNFVVRNDASIQLLLTNMNISNMIMTDEIMTINLSVLRPRDMFNQ
jgi:hypothetical protein